MYELLENKLYINDFENYTVEELKIIVENLEVLIEEKEENH